MTDPTSPIAWLSPDTPLPRAETAMRAPAQFSGLVAAGHDLSASRLLEAYGKGIFPWFSEGQPVLWWSPDPRMVLSTADFRLHPSMRKTLRQFRRNPDCEVRIDSAFDTVIRHCAQRPRPGQRGTWIVDEMIEAYVAFHRLGHVHSVETWINGELVGGLYVVSIGKALFGESMFALQSNASKMALAALIGFARAHDMPWIDCQQNTRHLASLGAREIKRSDFLAAVARDIRLTSPVWKFDSIYWNELDPLAPLSQ